MVTGYSRNRKRIHLSKTDFFFFFNGPPCTGTMLPLEVLAAVRKEKIPKYTRAPFSEFIKEHFKLEIKMGVSQEGRFFERIVRFRLYHGAARDLER